MILKTYRRQSLIIFFTVITIGWAVNFGFIQSAFLLDYIYAPYWWLVYVVLIPQFLFSYFYCLKFATKKETIPDVGKKFIIMLSLQGVLAILFLLPWLIYKDASSRPMVGHFFYVFFLLLIVETGLLVRYLNKFVPENSEEE
jgi:hypothetical protein